MSLKIRPLCLSSGLLLAFLIAAGCEKPIDTRKEQARTPAPAATPPAPMARGPMQSGMTDAEGPTDGAEVALKAQGLNSAEELRRNLARLNDQAAATDFETAFRYTFSAKMAQRNYFDAMSLAQKVIATHPEFAPAYRVLGYAQFNTGQATESLASYLKAVEIDPNYGEAHYALAFMYAMGDQTKGLEHFKKAMALGVKDERDLGNKFYTQAK